MTDKTDLQRWGLFSDLGYIATKEKYTPAANTINASSRGKGKQVVVSSTKTRDDTQAGYFASEYGRVFIGEAYADPVRLRRQERNLSKTRNYLGKNWLPSQRVKMPCGLGSFCPCIDTTPPAAFSSPFVKPEAKPFKAAFTTKPPKEGSGYGYSDVGMSKYPEYMSDSYMQYKLDQKVESESHKDRMKAIAETVFHCGRHGQEYFTKNPYREDPPIVRKPKKQRSLDFLGGPFIPPAAPKLEGGMKAGTFSRYPETSNEKYVSMGKVFEKNVVNKSGKTFYPSAYSKISLPTTSVLHQNVDKELTNVNYKTLQTVMKY